MKFIYLAASLLCSAAFGQADLCSNMTTCQDCFRIVNCTWCSETRTSSDKEMQDRCANVNKITPEWCGNEYIVNLKSSDEITESKPIGINENEYVHISPQRVVVKLRMGETYKLKFDYGVLKTYPMDLYYLSNSNMVHKTKLSKVGENLAKEMMLITKDFQLGFGSFVDKPMFPFADKIYGPDGGFDGLLQSVVCKNEIGWRPNARHVLVYSSDALFHIAGDGKLVGVVEPNDGECHIKNGSYTHGLVLDYPSIGQINQKAKENNIIIIFAVTISNEKFETYKQLAEQIEGATAVALAADSVGVVELIKKQYEHIVQSVTITDNEASLYPYISVKYLSSCLDQEGSLEPKKSCNGLTFTENQNKVTFHADIELRECPDDRNKWKKVLEIKPKGLKEKLIVEIEMLCDCPCVQSKLPGAFDQACNNAGSLECGLCKCDINHYGQFCECTKNKIDDKVDNSSCLANNSTQEICSNVGTCKCDICDCNKRNNPAEIYYGKFCECDNFSCKRFNDMLCSDHGRCECGTCKCYSGWNGDGCECPEDESSCIYMDDDAPCSNRGTCECGKCVCKEKGYTGKYCELCPECPGGLCPLYKDCVECKAYSSGLYSHDECEDKCKIAPILVNQLDIAAEKNEDRGEKRGTCIFLDSKQKCTFKYNYTETNELPLIYAQKEKECAATDLWAVIGGVVGGILLIGLFTLILWKILTTIHDYQEYMKFEKERANAKLSGGNNPLYISSKTTYENPTFGQKE